MGGWQKKLRLQESDGLAQEHRTVWLLRCWIGLDWIGLNRIVMVLSRSCKDHLPASRKRRRRFSASCVASLSPKIHDNFGGVIFSQ
jgi:hypothetical protein